MNKQQVIWWLYFITSAIGVISLIYTICTNWNLYEPLWLTLAGIPHLISNWLPRDKKSYINKRLKGIITFNYSNNNDIYTLWNWDLLFDIKFSKASDDCIHLYNDPATIEKIAIAKDKYSIKHIADASIFDFSSRSRTIKLWECGVLINKSWNYCVIKITRIKDDSRNDNIDEVQFEYVINPDWKTDFRD